MFTHRTQRKLQPVGGGSWTFYNDPTIPLVPLQHELKQDTYSWGHPVSRLGKTQEDIGGPFRTSSTWATSGGESFSVQGLGRTYVGTLHTSSSAATVTSLNYAANSPAYKLDAAGTTAIARTVPTNPVSSLSNAVGELHRDGVPHLPGSDLRDRVKEYRSLLSNRSKSDYRKAHPFVDSKEISDEYLNYVFGWLPLVSDLQKFARSAKNHNKIIRQLHRDSGRNVRRRLTLTSESSSTDKDGPKWGWVAPFKCDGSQIDSWMIADDPTTGYITWSEKSRKLWFSGAYTYYLPEPHSGALGSMKLAEVECNKLLGTRLTPDVVWNLAPWSWAADWFSNTGDVTRAWSALGADSLVMRYGYVMEEVSESSHGIWQGSINTPAGPRRISLHDATGSTAKIRSQATPYGFGIDIATLSSKQISITAALGMSRSPRVAL